MQKRTLYNKVSIFYVICLFLLSACDSGNDDMVDNPDNTLSMPMLLSPSSGMMHVDTMIELQWSPSVDTTGVAVTYSVYLDSQDATTEIANDLSANSYEVNNLREATTYYWQVVATNSRGDVARSEVYTFSTNDPNKAIRIKDGVIYLDEIAIQYNQEEIVLKKDSLMAEGNEQGKYHLLQKHNDTFYLIELDISVADDNSRLKIINDFNQLEYDDTRYTRNELEKIPAPFTSYSYGADSDEGKIIFEDITQIIDERGLIKRGDHLQTTVWKDVARKTVGSVVRIEGGGSGWFIDKDLIVTNNHVVENTGEIVFNGDYTKNHSIAIKLFDGRETIGRAWFGSAHHDVALIKLDESFDDVNLLTLSNSEDVIKGELVLNIGGPNIAQTYGTHLAILGVMERTYDHIKYEHVDHMALVSGQSGSPVFNARGEVLGMVKLGGYDVSIRDGINREKITTTEPAYIFANPEVVRDPYVGPSSSGNIGNKAMVRLISFWLKSVDRTFPDQKLKLNNTYNWEESAEEFYSRIDINFPYEQIPAINSSLEPILKNIVTIEKQLEDPNSSIPAETAIVYDENYLIGFNFFSYNVGDVMDVISYDRQIRSATVVAVGSENFNFVFYLYELDAPFDEGTINYAKDNIASVGSSEPLLSLGKEYNNPYPGAFEVNPVMYENNGLEHQNAFTSTLPLFNLSGGFVGYSILATSHFSDPFSSRLFIRTVVPISSIVGPYELKRPADVFAEFSQLN